MKKISETVLSWGPSNAVTYDIVKTKAILFSKACGRKAKGEVANTKLVFREQKVKFNNKTTRWLRVWLDSRLTFVIHIRERVKKPQAVEARIKCLTKTYGLLPGLVQKIEIAAVQAIAFFRSEI